MLKKIHAEPAGTKRAGGDGCWHTKMYAGEGPPGGMLDVDLLQRSPTRKPPKEVSTWGGVPGLLSTRFFWRNRFQEGQVIFFFGPINSNVKEELQNRASLSRIYSFVVGWSLSSALGCWCPEQSHCWRWDLAPQIVLQAPILILLHRAPIGKGKAWPPGLTAQPS